MINELERAIDKLRKAKPLVICLTNYVTMDFMANSLLALGVAPIMSCDDSEFEELVKLSGSVNVNIGTLDNAFIERCQKAVELGKRYNKPVILDPVGAGASSVRTRTARSLMPFSDIIRGNASEIMALLDDDAMTLGVESTKEVYHAKDAAIKIAKNLNCTVVVSGVEDFISDGLKEKSLPFGSPLMPLVIGMGCMLTAVIGAFRAVLPDPFEAAYLATAYVGLCGNVAHSKTDKPGAFHSAFIDELYAADFEAMRKF